METKASRKSRKVSSIITPRITKTELPLVQANQNCDFHGYDVDAREENRLRRNVEILEVKANK